MVCSRVSCPGLRFVCDRYTSLHSYKNGKTQRRNGPTHTHRAQDESRCAVRDGQPLEEAPLARAAAPAAAARTCAAMGKGQGALGCACRHLHGRPRRRLALLLTLYFGLVAVFQNRARAVGGDLCACGSSSPRCWRVPSPALWQMPRPRPIPACKQRASRLSAHGSHLSLLRSVSFFLPP